MPTRWHFFRPERAFVNNTKEKWHATDYSQAISNAICQNANNRLLSKDGDKLKFNGFWRNGDKQNVCAWIDKATWHDAKTGNSGGCKEFAQIAFNMSLKEFMDRYGPRYIDPNQEDFKHSPLSTHAVKHSSYKIAAVSRDYVNSVWNQLQKHESFKSDDASQWLSKTRGILNPRSYIGSGYLNLINSDVTFFDKEHRDFIKHRLEKGLIIAVPLRDVHSDKVQNLFLRVFSVVDKSEKSRLLPTCGGWGNVKDGLRAFGYPHLINDFPNIILCEGMADYCAAEYLLDRSEKYLPLGAANADAIVKWAQWLGEKKYKGCVHFIYQLDSNAKGQVSPEEIGPKKTLKAAQIIFNAGIKAKPFNWFKYLTHTTKNSNNVSDLADSLENELLLNECGHEHLQFMFKLCLEEMR